MISPVFEDQTPLDPQLGHDTAKSGRAAVQWASLGPQLVRDTAKPWGLAVQWSCASAQEALTPESLCDLLPSVVYFGDNVRFGDIIEMLATHLPPELHEMLSPNLSLVFKSLPLPLAHAPESHPAFQAALKTINPATQSGSSFEDFQPAIQRIHLSKVFELSEPPEQPQVQSYPSLSALAFPADFCDDIPDVSISGKSPADLLYIPIQVDPDTFEHFSGQPTGKVSSMSLLESLYALIREIDSF